MFLGSFDEDFTKFQTDVVSAVEKFRELGVTRLIIDVTNNGGRHATCVTRRIALD